MSESGEPTNELISVKQAAQLLNWKIPKVLRFIKTGKIKAEKVGWGWIVSRSSVLSQVKQDGPKK